MLQSSFGVTSFVNEVVFLKMPSRQEAKRHAKYLEVRDDVLESARASYKAEPEKKRTAERERYQAEPEKKRTAERERYQAEPEKKRTAERERYQAEPEKKRTAERERYQAEPEKKRTAERERYQAEPEKKRSAERERYQKDQKRNGPLKGNVIGRVPESAGNQYGSLTINYASSIMHRNNVHEKK